MSKKATTKTAAKKAARKSVVDPANVAKITAAMKAEMPKVKAGELSRCEAIRKIAGKHKNIRRVEIEQSLVKDFHFNLGTVRRQIQEARA